MQKVLYHPGQEILCEDMERQADYITQAQTSYSADFMGSEVAMSGLEVKAQPTPDMTVYVEKGRMYIDGLQGELETASDAYTVIAAHPSYDRIDRLVAAYHEVEDLPETRNVMIDTVSRQVVPQVLTTRKRGAVSFLVVTGVANTMPAAPVVPDGYYSLAQIRVRASTAQILQSDILDERVIRTLGKHQHSGSEINGSVASAKKLETARRINGVPFNGEEDIELGGGLPVGTILTFPAASIPSGYLKCNGAAVGRETYPELFALIGTTYGAGDGSTTFNLPDLRGEFIRGLDDGRGVDSGRVLGSNQGDELKSHTHITLVGLTAGTAGQVAYEDCQKQEQDKYIESQPTGGTETRPRNIAMIYCIKAFDAPVDQGTVVVSELAQDIAGLSTRINDLALKKLWVSGEYTPVLNTPTIVTHGLNIDPFKAKGEVLLKCVVAEQGYSVGDFAITPTSLIGSTASAPLTPALSATTIQINTGGISTGINIAPKTNGTATTVLTLSNWRYIFRISY